MVSRSDNSTLLESDGPQLVAAARKAIAHYLQTSRIEIPSELLKDPRFDQRLGCFVTLKMNDTEKSLRGCIGFPEPTHKLSEALPKAAIYAATDDPRFPAVVYDELEALLVEVSVLTRPSRVDVLNPEELPSSIDVGTDGLVLKWPFGSGLLLPQVALEQDWDVHEYLENLSLKAGATPDQWRSRESVIYKFKAQVFQETSPKGPVYFKSD